MSSSSLPFPRILMGPGPSSVSSRVLEVMGRAPIGYLDPELFAALSDIQSKLRVVFGTSNEATLAMTGTGMAGMETCLGNLIEPGDNVIIGVCGFFGGRMVEIAERLGANVTRIDGEWGRPIDANRFHEAAAAIGNIRLIGCVHAETSTGVRQPLGEIGKIASEFGALFLVDAVTSLGGIPVELDKVRADASYSGTQKCMGAPPGLSPVTFSAKAMDVIRNRKTKPSWYFDIQLVLNYWTGDHMYHHTVPGNLLLALHESLVSIEEEGLANRFERHQSVSDRLIFGLSEMGIVPFAQDGYRLPTLNSVVIPDGVDDMAVRKSLLMEYGLEIGGGLGPLKGKIWRIGTMGESASHRNVELLLASLKTILNR